jgi:hypothetical protein
MAIHTGRTAIRDIRTVPIAIIRAMPIGRTATIQAMRTARITPTATIPAGPITDMDRAIITTV